MSCHQCRSMMVLGHSLRLWWLSPIRWVLSRQLMADITDSVPDWMVMLLSNPSNHWNSMRCYLGIDITKQGVIVRLLIISIPQWLIPVMVLPPEVLVRLQTSCLNLPLSIVKFLAFIIFLYWEVMAIRRIYGRIIGCGTGIFLQTSLAGIISL